MALLFSSPWQSKKPQKRIDALRKLPPEQAADILAQLALNDPEEQVRLAAVQHISSPGTLTQLLAKADNPAKKALRQRLISVLDNNANAGASLALESRQRWLRNCEDHDTLEHLACYATEPELRKTALLQANQQKLWQHCIQHDPLMANRELAIDRVENVNALKQLVDSLRKSDKHITRLLQHALEQKLLDEGDPETIKALQLRCCEQLDKLIETKAPQSKLRDVDAEWAQLSGSDPTQQFAALAERYARSRRVFLRLHEPVEAEPEETGEAAPAPEAPQITEAKHIFRKAKSWLNGDKLPRRKHLTALRKQWRALKADITDAALAEDISEQLSQLNQRLLQQDSEWKERLEKALQQLPQIKPLLDKGQLQNARDLFQDTETTLQALKAIENRAELREALETLNALRPSLQKLGELQHWSNNIKRRELCERVEALIAQDIEPEALAEQIQKAQADWKALDAAEKAKGESGQASPAIWKRFQTLCRKAWEPCAEHFEQKRQTRALKREHIEKVMHDLEAFGDKARRFDQSVIDTAVRSGYRMLSELHRMPFKERRSLEKNLRQALEPFQQANEQQQKQAAYAKKQLIEKASQLKPEDDLGNAIKQMKQLQMDWKKTGKTDPKSDRELWADFRKQADRVFAVLDAQRKQENETRKNANSQLASLVNEIGALAEHASDATLHELHKLSSQAEAIESDADNRKLSSQLAAAKLTVEKAVKAQANKQRLERLVELAKTAATRMQDAADDTAQQAALDAVINMEIMAGKESPSTDKSRRLELQVAQLSANLSGGGKNHSLIEQAEAWYENAQTTPEAWKALHKRVQALLS